MKTASTTRHAHLLHSDAYFRIQIFCIEFEGKQQTILTDLVSNLTDLRNLCVGRRLRSILMLDILRGGENLSSSFLRLCSEFSLLNFNLNAKGDG